MIINLLMNKLMPKLVIVVIIVVVVFSQAWISEPYSAKMLVEHPLPTFTTSDLTDHKAIKVDLS